MISQSIVNLKTKEIVMEEWLCRPLYQSTEEYFTEEDPYRLWLKEEKCLREAIDRPSSFPKAINLTLSSIPYFIETNWTWKGIVEIVEWGLRKKQIIKHLPYLLPLLRQRGLRVYVDDVAPQTWLMWRYQKVDGYKISWQDLKKGGKDPFFKEGRAQLKPMVLERIDNKELESLALRLGFEFGQGWLYSKPS